MSTVKLASIKEVSPGKSKIVDVGGKAIALFNINGTFYAINNRCTHVGGPLGQGALKATL